MKISEKARDIAKTTKTFVQEKSKDIMVRINTFSKIHINKLSQISILLIFKK